MGDVCSNASSCSSQPPQDNNNKTSLSWEGLVYVVFSSVSLTKLKECGMEKVTLDKEGCTVAMEKWINEVVWEDSPKNYSPDTSKANKKIFVNCNDAQGDELYQASGLYGKNEQRDSKIQEIKLINEIVFAIRQLKDFLYKQEKDGYYTGGNVKLCVSAVDPVQCLMFAFLRVLGFTIEQDTLNDDFLQKVFSNPVIQKTKDWMNRGNCKWKVELHYCSVQRIDVQELKVLTEKGKRAERKGRIIELRDALKEPTNTILGKWKACRGYKSNSNYADYEKALDEWKKQGGQLKRPYQGEWDVELNMDYPAVEFEGSLRHIENLNKLIRASDREEQRIIAEANKPENWEKNKEDIDKEIAKQEAELKKKRDKDKKERLDVIKEKQDELEKRNSPGTDESNFWNERYMQDYDTAEDYEKDQGLIEFEGDLVTKEQLDAKVREINEDNNRRRHEIEKLKEASQKIQDNIDDLFWDRVLTGIQLGLAVACLIAAPFAAPFAGVALGLAIGSAVADAGLEVVKWVVIDDTWDEHIVAHSISIGLDIVSAGLAPLFRKIPQVTRLASDYKMAEESLNAVAKVSGTTEAAAIAADTAARNTARAAEDAAIAAEKAAISAKQVEEIAEGWEKYATVILKEATEEAGKKVAASELGGWKRALVMLNANMPSKASARALEATDQQINTFIEKAVSNSKYFLTAAEVNLMNAKGNSNLRKFLAQVARENADAAARAVETAGGAAESYKDVLKASNSKNAILKELQEQSADLFAFYKHPLTKVNKASDLAASAKGNRILAGAIKFLGFDNVVELDRSLAKLDKSIALSNRIGYIRNGYYAFNVSKHGVFIFNGFSYGFGDYILDYDYLEGVNLKPLNDAETIAKGLAEIKEKENGNGTI